MHNSPAFELLQRIGPAFIPFNGATLFTIIIPTHDRPHLLHRTLQSVARQTFTDFAVIVVSDSATYLPPFQDLKDMTGRYTYLVHNHGNGPASSRNMGLDLVQTPFVMFLDDDDTLAPDHLMNLSKLLDRHSSAIHFCNFKVLEEDRTETPPQFLSVRDIDIGGVARQDVFVLNRIPNSCLIYPADALKGQRFDGSIILYEDWDFLLHCLKDRDLSHIPIDSVVIHKSYAAGQENARRGNSSNQHLMEVTLELYRRHPAAHMETRLARQALFAQSGVTLSLDHF